MIRKREVLLKVELLANGDERRFSVRSQREILSILKGIAHDSTRVALYYDDENDFILTTMLKANDRGVWLEVGSSALKNQDILRSNKIVFISSHHQIKVQFVSSHIETSSIESETAFFMPLPESLLRIQRREYFRLTTPASNPLRCVIPASKPDNTAELTHHAAKKEVTIMDISGGGIALVCEARDIELLPGKTYFDCRISLPDVGIITATLLVKNSFEVTLRNGQISRRAGCEFAGLSGVSETMLQRYVVRLQGEGLVKT